MSIAGNFEKSSLAAPLDAAAGWAARRWWLHDGLIVALLALLLGRLVSGALGEQNFGINVAPDGGVTIRDLAAHVTFARAFWSGDADYSAASHVRVTDGWAGESVGRALPFGYSPTMLWLLGPFCLVPNAWAYVAWTLLGGAAVWWMSRRRRTIFVIGGLVLLGPLGHVCLALGQTALLTSAGLIFLLERSLPRTRPREIDRAWSWSLWPDALVLWALTAKPPLALVAAAALLAVGHWRSVVLAGGITALATAALTPWLGTEWVGQYLDLITHYNRESADAAFAWSLRPDHMSNLRAVLWHAGWLGEARACRLSSVLWLVALGGMIVAGMRGRVAPAAAWGYSLLAFLVLCPHVTSTEDLHLALLLAIVVVARPLPKPAIVAAIVALVALVACAAPEATVTAGAARSAGLFAAKLALVALCFAGYGRSGPPANDE